MRKTWMLASTLLWLAACGDDDEPTNSTGTDGGGDPVGETVRDAGSAESVSMDSGASVNLDASALPDTSTQDAELLPDASLTPIDAGGGDVAKAPIEIAGNWHDGKYGGETLISATTFGYANLVEYDNTARTAITQNQANDPYGPNKFSKQVWTAPKNGAFYLCTQDYGKDTVEEARATTMKADPSDPANGGCGDSNFSWTYLVPAIEIGGTWRLGAESYAIDSDKLGDLDIESYDNEANWAITSTMGAKFNKVVWTQPSAKELYLCVTADDLETQAAAEADTTVADATQLTTGCLGGSWTALAQP
ncbi:MAG TPA: hypothetical protein VI299_00780 [Polyangiales bacterium]